jgi:predicted AAA+ superfamily ATPase
MRAMASRLKGLMEHFPALVLTGARQAGKTTLLRNCFPGHRYVTLDLPSVAEQAERDPQSFFRTNPPPLIVDEVQYAPGLFRHVKTQVDRDRGLMGRFILTGSQNFRLMKGVSESLAGRCAVVELENLSWQELSAHGLAGPWIHFVTRGQFPELWRDPDIRPADFHSSYLATYLERDVRQILNVTSLRDFERFIRILAARSGSLLNKTEVARDIGVSVKAVGDWTNVLEASGQIVLLEPWFSNFGKRIVKTPKVYFSDSGLLCFLLGLDERSVPSSPFLGPVWESFVFAEMRKVVASSGDPCRFWFYRDQGSREIDFVLEKAGQLSFVEAKWSEHPDPHDVRTINAVDVALSRSDGPWKPGRHAIISRTAASYPITDKVRAIGPESIPEMIAGLTPAP